MIENEDLKSKNFVGAEQDVPRKPDIDHDEVIQFVSRVRTEFVGLAIFLRMSMAGTDMSQLGQLLVEETQRDQGDANLWMNLSTSLYTIQADDLADSAQQQALMQKRTYTLPSPSQPAQFRLLMLMVPGNLGENMPLDCLLEGSPVELIYHYMSLDEPLPTPLPEHTAVVVAFSDKVENRPFLEKLNILLDNWERPVINQPSQVPNAERHRASEVLQNVQGLLIPPTYELSREQLRAVTRGETQDARVVFPVIVRPVYSHGGHGLERIDNAQSLSGYLIRNSTERYYVSPFIDYSSEDRLFRKFRVVLVDGHPFAGHMAISSHWMVHYLNAGMYEDAAKRAEEQAFMEHFDEFAQRHAVALRAIYERIGLDYLCIDCAETRDGQLLIFEVGHEMVVHAMDPVDLFPYKQVQIAKVRKAFEDYLLRLSVD